MRMSKWSGLVCRTGTHDAAMSVQKTTVKSGFSISSSLLEITRTYSIDADKSRQGCIKVQVYQIKQVPAQKVVTNQPKSWNKMHRGNYLSMGDNLQELLTIRRNL